MAPPPFPPAAIAPVGADLTSLSPLPSEVIAMIFRAYIDTTPLSSPHFQDLLCLDRRIYNSNVQRLYDKVTLHAGNARKFYEGIEEIWDLNYRERWWVQPELADFLRVQDLDDEDMRVGTQEAWVTGKFSLPDGCPVRYPKHYLIRRVSQVTFMDWEAISCTAAARDIFSLWLEEHPDPWDDDDAVEDEQPPPATFFQHMEGSIIPTISDHPWSTAWASLYHDFTYAPEVCLPMPSVTPSFPSPPRIPLRIQYPLKGIWECWQPVRLTIHNADPCPRWTDWHRYGPSRIDLLSSLVEEEEGSVHRGWREKVEENVIPEIARQLIQDWNQATYPPEDWEDNPISLSFYNLHSDVAKVKLRLEEMQQRIGYSGDFLKVGLYSRDHDFVCSMCGRGG
ncbi:hypothetical protein IAT38_006582 [Cryptococcus sp. DSM 104549]